MLLCVIKQQAVKICDQLCEKNHKRNIQMKLTVLFWENLEQKPHLVQKHRCTVDAWRARVWLPGVGAFDGWLVDL